MSDTRFAGLLSQILDRLQVKEALVYKSEKEFLKHLKPDHPVRFQWSDGDALPSELVYSDTLHKSGLIGLDDNLDRLKALTNVVGFFYARIPTSEDVDTGDIDQPSEWWLKKIMERFDVQTFQRLPDGFYVVVYPKPIEIIH